MIVFENNKIAVKLFVCNHFSENTYLLWNKHTKESVLIDPGFYSLQERNSFQNYVSEQRLQMKYIVNTHGHLDHIFGNKFACDTYKVPFYISEIDTALLKIAKEQAALFNMEIDDSPMPDNYINETTTLSVGEVSLSFLFTPGHTPGEYSIYLKESGICFSGDVLFRESIGRTDLWGGSINDLIQSIKNKLFTLDENTIVFPGHGESTTIASEKENNPFFF